MSLTERQELIRKIQQQRQSKLITYVTGTRPGSEFQMAMDAIRYIYDHLPDKKVEKLDIFLYSNGGDGVVPWRLVTLLREHCVRLGVLVPYRAFSAATLTALGADEIVMHPMGMLGPTDPTVSNAFNPRDAAGNQLGIGVEDVAAFLAIARDDLGLSQEGQIKTLELLASQVHPLALGNAKRSQAQSRMMAQKLLSLHMDCEKDRAAIETIVDSLTSKLYYHGHPINRNEAKDLGLRISEDSDKEALIGAMWDLYLDYEQEMQLSTPFRPVDLFVAHCSDPACFGQPQTMPPISIEGARIESASRSNCFSRELVISGTRGVDGSANIQISTHSEGWQ